jgi:putative two-component system response regulator
MELLVRQRLRAQIERCVYDFSFASDGVNALEMLSAMAEKAELASGDTSFLPRDGDEPAVCDPAKFLPEIVLTDINMPRMDGLELSERIHSLYPSIVVIVVSAYDDMENIRKAMRSNASDFLVKPIDFTELELTIEKSHQRHAEILEYNRKIHESSSMLKRTLGKTLEAISMIGEIRDPYTAGHQKRVATLTRALAKKLGLGPDRQEGVFVAATLHDVGKIYVPAEILAKPGKLTAVEYNLIKEHSRLGYEILRSIEFPWPVAEIVYQHHEHLDGSGYPRGLKGDEIMFEARLLSVADFVEAVSSHRPYRIALGSEVAINDINVSSGTFFDPAIVNACAELFESGDFAFPPQD